LKINILEENKKYFTKIKKKFIFFFFFFEIKNLNFKLFLEALDHENIIAIIDLLKPEAKTGFNDIYIITDLMETDLHRVIYSRQVKKEKEFIQNI
jgi:hypothetical protein